MSFGITFSILNPQVTILAALLVLLKFLAFLVFGIVDSHAHMNSEEFDEDRDQVIKKAFQEGITAILCPAEITDSRNLETTFDLIIKYENIVAAGGAHPHQANGFSPGCIGKIEELAKAKKIKAVGEIGLDFHYNFSPPRTQIQVFRQQLNIAQKWHLPVVIHSRKAGREIAQAIEEEQFTSGGILHCFTEDWEFAKRMLSHNFFISFSGILTLPKAFLLREVAKKIPLEKLLVETDSPYLIPAPFRGREKRNEPRFVIEIAKFLAELKNISFEELEEETTQHFESLFHLK